MSRHSLLCAPARPELGLRGPHRNRTNAYSLATILCYRFLCTSASFISFLASISVILSVIIICYSRVCQARSMRRSGAAAHQLQVGNLVSQTVCDKRTLVSRSPTNCVSLNFRRPACEHSTRAFSLSLLPPPFTYSTDGMFH